jgi:hypothetical protein
MKWKYEMCRGEYANVTTDNGEFFGLSSCLVRPLEMNDDDWWWFTTILNVMQMNVRICVILENELG